METLIREAWQEHGRIPHDLKEQIVVEHTSLISYIVSRIAVRLPSHVDLDDLHNTGVIGLMDAVDKYDPTKDCKFKTYAEFRIRGAILDQLRSLDWVPRSVRQKSRQLETACNQIEQRLGRPATDDEIAGSLGINLDELHVMVNQTRGISIVNMDDLRGSNDSDQPLPSGNLEDVNAEDPFASLRSRELTQSLAKGIDSLPEKERLVISLYYYEDLNLKEIGSILGITESRVCQIHSKAVSRLRSRMRLSLLN
ncbi:MAG: FliA/WhiG family RNA polymerase sigma factor [bacterium]|nr:FliA/WhiG family RNA polymerase sigma factor [bacterium]